MHLVRVIRSTTVLMEGNKMVTDVVKLLDTYKAQAAFFAPFLITVLGVIATWIATGEFNVQEIRTGAAGLVAAIAAAIGVYFAKAGRAEIEVDDAKEGWRP
jgi:hypothetical protein